MRSNQGGGTAPTEHGGPTLHVAVVYGVNDVRHIAAAESRAALAVKLADYARRNAVNQLWPGDARRLLRLLAAGRFEAAVEHYFASVGGRWDEERLVIEAVGLGEESGAAVPRRGARPREQDVPASRP